MFCCVLSGREILSAALRERGRGVPRFENREKLQNEELLSIFQVITAVLLKVASSGKLSCFFKVRFPPHVSG